MTKLSLGRLGLAALALVALLAVGALGAAAATSKKPAPKTAAKCPKPKAGKKVSAKCASKSNTPTSANQLCELGQAFPNAHYKKPECKPNPIFAKSICATFVPALKAMDPNVTWNNGYFPNWTGTEVSCYYAANGHKQAFSINIDGGVGRSTTQAGKLLTPAQAFAYAEKIEVFSTTCPIPSAAWAQANPNQQPQSQPAVNTTIDGYKAWTWDPCASPQPDSPAYSMQWGAVHQASVLAGTAIISLYAKAPIVDVTTAQFMPLFKQLIATYKTNVS